MIKEKYAKVGGGRKTKLTKDEEKILDYCRFMTKSNHYCNQYFGMSNSKKKQSIIKVSSYKWSKLEMVVRF